MEPVKNTLSVPISIIVAALILGGALFLRGDAGTPEKRASPISKTAVASADTALLIPWGDLGGKLLSLGVIDREKLEGVYVSRGGLGGEEQGLLDGDTGTRAELSKHNAQFMLNLLWALGLAQKSDILLGGPMMDQRYGGADRFASTGGWTLARANPKGDSFGLADGHAMDHYGRHMFFVLTEEQETLVGKVAQGIFRPCCDNPAYFPDCNHGMAMLGLLELLASEGATEDELYAAAFAANQLWFPDQYALIAEYREAMEKKGRSLSERDLVSRSVVSGSGFQRLASERATWGGSAKENSGGGGGCGV